MGDEKKEEQKVEEAEKAVAADEFDLEAWDVLVSAAQRTAGGAAAVLERVLRVYPTSEAHWRLLVDELRAHTGIDDAPVEAAFTRALAAVPSVRLWADYIAFALARPSAPTTTTPEARTALYERALAAVGRAADSAPLWDAYLAHLGTLPAPERDTQLRAAYQRVVRLPTAAVDRFWADYEAWERRVGGDVEAAARSLQGRVQAARRVHRARGRLLEGLELARVARPPSAPSTTAAHAARTQQQLVQWRALVAYDQSNPLRLTPQEHADAMRFVYDRCLVCLHFYPQIWWSAAHFYLSPPPSASSSSSNSPSQATTTPTTTAFNQGCEYLKRAAAALPHHVPAHLAYAECLAASGRADEARHALEGCLAQNADAPLVWIRYMQLVRAGARGTAVEDARKVFLKARKRPGCTWHVYVAAAEIEQFRNNDAASARKLYDHALAAFPDALGLVRAYADYLLHAAGVDSVRALYERQLRTAAPAAARALWDDLVALERLHGDAASRASTARRRAAFLAAHRGDAPALAAATPDSEYTDAVHALAYRDLPACADTDLARWGVFPAPAPASPPSPVQRPVETKPLPPPPVVQPQMPVQQPVPQPQPQQQQLPPPVNRDDASVAALLGMLPPARLYGGPAVDIERLLAVLRLLPAAPGEPPLKHMRLA